MLTSMGLTTNHKFRPQYPGKHSPNLEAIRNFEESRNLNRGRTFNTMRIVLSHQPLVEPVQLFLIVKLQDQLPCTPLAR
jgi:hypothetical protein